MPRTILLCVSLNLKAQPPESLPDRAQRLFSQYQLQQSHDAYRQIASDRQNTAGVRIKAYLALANQDWRFYKDYPAAEKDIALAVTLKPDPFNCHLLAAGIEDDAARYDKSLIDGQKSLNLAKTPTDRINAELALAKAIHDENLYRLRHRQPVNVIDLKHAAALLERVLELQPGNPQAGELMTGTGLLLKDGRVMLQGWRSYYLVSNDNDVNEALAGGFKLLKPFEQWKGEVLNEQQLNNLALGLAGTKFFDYANDVIASLRNKYPAAFAASKQLRDIVTYAAYIDGLKKVDDDIYPQVARGLKKYDDAYDSLMNIPARKAWSELSFIPKTKKFDPDTLYDILNRVYGMEGYSGTTVGYYGMLMGHIIHSELKQINQYGYATKFTYISVDRLISRDFTSWYGTTNVGGWGDSTTIIQVRKAYMTEPFDELGWMMDPTARAAILAKIAALKQADCAVCRKDKYVEPKFLALSIKFNEANKIYQRLADSGLTGMKRSIAFIDQILRLTVASTVFAHEGRHAIDQLYFPKEFKAMSDDERELRAKYSEVIYSLDPKMAFTGSIMGSDLDENTNHGKANKRFRIVIVDWMSAHSREIKGLDERQPLLMQFDLLTNDQLIAICKSADPMANDSKR